MNTATKRPSDKRRRQLLKARLSRIGYAIIGIGDLAKEGADDETVSKKLNIAQRALEAVPDNYGLPRVAL